MMTEVSVIKVGSPATKGTAGVRREFVTRAEAAARVAVETAASPDAKVATRSSGEHGPTEMSCNSPA